MRQLSLQEREKYQIHICCVCGEARDDISGDGAWKPLEEYTRRYGIQEGLFVLSHTFCPPCLMAYEKLLGLGRALDVPWPFASSGG